MPGRTYSGRSRRPRLEFLEHRRLLAADHNFVEAEDVNLDGHVSALDALNIINEIRQQQNQADGERVDESQFLSDVNESGEITSGDALEVINQLARGKRDANELNEGIDKLADAILTETLPEDLSISGNTHLSMQDNNSEFIAGLIADWLETNLT